MLKIFISKVIQNAFIMIKQLFLQEGGGGLKSPQPLTLPGPCFWHSRMLSQFTETGATQTMKTNQMAEPKQQIPALFKSSQSNVLFSNPANQTSGTKQ